MNIEELREYCLNLKGATEEFPFDDVNLVLKVKGKMFGLIPLANPELQISLKCDPERAIALREEFEAIVPAWHFNKKHWNTVYVHPSISTEFLFEQINHSYQLVVDGLPAKLKKELEDL